MVSSKTEISFPYQSIYSKDTLGGNDLERKLFFAIIEFLRQVKICLVGSIVNFWFTIGVIAVESARLCNQKSATESQNFGLKCNMFIKTTVFTIMIFLEQVCH